MKIYYLATCSTCKKIIDEWQIDESFELQDIKTEKITESQLEALKNLAGSFESLFSRRAMKYRERNLHEKKLTEIDYKNLILEEYTFLKRPVLVLGNQVFVGNAKKNVQAAKKAILDARF